MLSSDEKLNTLFQSLKDINAKAYGLLKTIKDMCTKKKKILLKNL